MDIIDIIIAKAQANAIPVSIASLERQAKQAVKDANDAVAAIDEIEDRATTAAETAETAAESLVEIASTVDTKIDAYDTETVAPMREDIETLQEAQITDYVSDFATSTSTTSAAVTTTITASRNGKADVTQTFKNYQATGQNTDGSMTQKAITDALTAINEAIENIDISGAIPTFSTDDAGKLLMVGNNGSIVASSLTEASVINTQLETNTFMPERAIGIEIDYANKTVTYIEGSCEPDELVCYSGRKRCVVDSNSKTVKVYYGDANYVEDGSLGEVMVELPPVWYRRVIIESAAAPNGNGTYIKKERIFITDTPTTGFELHPLFHTFNGEILPSYIGAYEGAIINGKLCSIAGVQPTTNISLENAIAAANQNGYQLSDLRFESYNQLMMLMEFGTLNIQEAFYPGVTQITDTGTTYCAAVLTGATASLGNESGEATSSVSVVNGVSTTYTESGKVSISYRGMENPYGNTWRYSEADCYPTHVLVYHHSEQETLYFPTQNEWVSTFNATTLPYFIPLSSSITADSSLPVGDYCFIGKNLATARVAVGGAYNSDQQAGPFTYAVNRESNNTASIWRGFRIATVLSSGEVLD